MFYLEPADDPVRPRSRYILPGQVISSNLTSHSTQWSSPVAQCNFEAKCVIQCLAYDGLQRRLLWFYTNCITREECKLLDNFAKPWITFGDSFLCPVSKQCFYTSRMALWKAMLVFQSGPRLGPDWNISTFMVLWRCMTQTLVTPPPHPHYSYSATMRFRFVILVEMSWQILNALLWHWKYVLQSPHTGLQSPGWQSCA